MGSSKSKSTNNVQNIPRPTTEVLENIFREHLTINSRNTNVQSPAPVLRVAPRQIPQSWQPLESPLSRVFADDARTLINSRQLSKPEKSKFIPIISEDMDLVVTYSPLMFHDPEYQFIYRKITKKNNFKVDLIEKVENPYLEKAYELKKEQKVSEFSFVEEHFLFHGTKECCVDKICEENFDWRMCQQHKYGKGVSFSPNSTYASNYSERNVDYKIMLVAKVLICEICDGNEFMQLPDDGCDTSQKSGGVVIVKFEDNEFYPAYKITYHLVDENVGRKVVASRGRRRHY